MGARTWVQIPPDRKICSSVGRARPKGEVAGSNPAQTPVAQWLERPHQQLSNPVLKGGFMVAEEVKPESLKEFEVDDVLRWLKEHGLTEQEIEEIERKLKK